MTFQEIFNKDGLYKTDTFTKGTAFKISDGQIWLAFYSSDNDLFPSIEKLVVYKGLFTKEYTKILTVKELF